MLNFFIGFAFFEAGAIFGFFVAALLTPPMPGRRMTMKKFEVEITETLQRTVTVEAASQEEAERMVDRGWRDGDYVLTDEDYVGVDFKTTGEHELSEKKMLDVLLVKPNEHPRNVSIGAELEDLQQAVGGSIGASYPFADDPVAIVYNDDGKLMGLP